MGTQSKPEELTVILRNNGLLGGTIGVCSIPLQPLIATSGNESTCWYKLKTEGKGKPAGEIEIALMFTTDASETVHASKEEEEDNEVEVAQAKQGKTYVPPPRVVARKEKQQKKKQQA